MPNLDEILAVPGLTSIVFGPFDLAGSMGFTAQPNHPEVFDVLEKIVAKTRKTTVWAGISVGGAPEVQAAWVQKGGQCLLCWLPSSSAGLWAAN